MFFASNNAILVQVNEKTEGCKLQPATIITMIIVIGAVVVATIIMYRMSKKAQKQRDEQQAQLDAAAQQITMLVIDKKKMRLREYLKKTYNSAEKCPAIRASICTGEQVAGFRDIHTGAFEEIMLIKDQADLEVFRNTYGIKTEREKIY